GASSFTLAARLCLATFLTGFFAFDLAFPPLLGDAFLPLFIESDLSWPERAPSTLDCRSCARDFISAFIRSRCLYLPRRLRVVAAFFALDFFFPFAGTRFMLGLIIARCCAKTRIDERIRMLTSQIRFSRLRC